MPTNQYSSGVGTENLCISFWIQVLLKIASEASAQSGRWHGTCGLKMAQRWSRRAWPGPALSSSRGGTGWQLIANMALVLDPATYSYFLQLQQESRFPDPWIWAALGFPLPAAGNRSSREPVLT